MVLQKKIVLAVRANAIFNFKSFDASGRKMFQEKFLLIRALSIPQALTPRDSAFHALNRLAYGPRPGDVARVAGDGVMRWIDRQLSPDRIDDDPLDRRERQFSILGYDRSDLAALYVAAQRQRVVDPPAGERVRR